MKRSRSMRAMTRALLAVVALVVACTAVHEPTAPSPPPRSMDYAVYDVVLDSLFPPLERVTAPMQYVVGDSTVPVRGSMGLAGGHVEEVFGSLLLPFVRNTTASLLERNVVRTPL